MSSLSTASPKQSERSQQGRSQQGREPTTAHDPSVKNTITIRFVLMTLRERSEGVLRSCPHVGCASVGVPPTNAARQRRGASSSGVDIREGFYASFSLIISVFFGFYHRRAYTRTTGEEAGASLSCSDGWTYTTFGASASPHTPGRQWRAACRRLEHMTPRA